MAPTARRRAVAAHSAQAGPLQPPVAITGMAVMLPGAPDLATYWQNLTAGSDMIGDVPPGRWDSAYHHPGSASEPAAADRVYCRRGGFVDAVAEVDVTRFGIMPHSVPGTEPDQLIALHVAASALADAGGAQRLPDRDRVGIVLGRGGYLTPGLARLDQRVRTARQLVRTLGDLMPGLDPGQLERVRVAFTDRLGPARPEDAIGLVPNLAASRVANRLDLRGPAYTVDAACASSLLAVDQAVAALGSGRCDVMLAGGVHHCHDITLWSVFAQLRALSPSERIRPFHRDADGILIGEGTGVVVLKRLADAERDGDRVYAVIRGTGVSSDGRTSGLVNPDPAGQTRAVRAAWRAAGLDPAEPGSIGLLEAHGTGTPAGDTAELETLRAVFGPPRPAAGPRAGTEPAEPGGREDHGDRGHREDRPVIGSVKSMIGHAMPAAGVAGLVKAALAVHHGTLLPTLHCEDPHPALSATRFAPISRAVPWVTGPGRPRRAAVNAFGFGGVNAHVVLEEAPPASGCPSPGPAGGSRAEVREGEPVLLLSAATPEALAALLDAADPRTPPGGPASGPVRLGIVCPTPKRLALARRVVARGEAWHGRNDVWFRPGPLLGGGPDGGGTAFLFPGLEGEFTPRVDDIADHFGLPRPPLAAPRTGPDGRRPEPGGGLGRHGLGVVAVGRLLDTALRRIGIVPDAVAGHSVGEWTAMAVGGLYEEAAVDAFMTALDPETVRGADLAYAAVGAGAGRVNRVLARGLHPSVVLSHDNAPNQSMVCGPPEDVEAFAAGLRAEGVLVRVLPFRSGFHTPMLAPLLEPIRAAAGRMRLRAPHVPVWSGTTAAPFPPEEAAIRALFVRHLLEPVRFRALTDALYGAGIRVFVQAGPGQLGSLVGDTLAGRDHLVVAASSPHRDGMAQLRRVATALWTAGAETDPRSLQTAGTPAAASPPGAVPGPARQCVRLDLGSALVDLAPDPALVAALARDRAAADPAGVLDTAAAGSPVAAELAALLRETAQTAADVMAAAGTPPPERAPRLPAPPARPAAGVVRAATAPAATGTVRTATAPVTGSAGSGTGRAGAGTAGAGTAGSVRHERVRVGVDRMPYLLDHCFFPQRADWPDVADRWPVVPATTIVAHLMAAAERALPGKVAVEVHDACFDRWLTAADPVDVPVTVTPRGPDLVAVSFGPDARAVVALADRHPGAPSAPHPPDPGSERVPAHTAEQVYRERWMFHGPSYQGMARLTAIGDRHVRATLTTPAAPGALLDNVGQVLGYWIMATHTERTVVFPVRVRHLRFFGPHPAPGTPVECAVRIVSLTDTVLEADAVLTVAGQVWAQLTGWQDRRFDNDPHTRPVERFPDRNTLSATRPGGWSVVFERWPGLASRELIMRNALGGPERSAYAERPPRGRRQWLLGRIAAKDAVRRLLWADGEGPVYPAELLVGNEASGRPYVTGRHGRELPPLDVSIAHCAEAGVALARHRPPGGDPGALRHGPGIDVEEITEPAPATVATALSPAEQELLAACRAAGGGGEPPGTWFTRFWTAKEAVAKAEGTGLRGRPRDFEVTRAEADRLTVTVRPPDTPTRTYRVGCERIANPAGLPPRTYVVAWTTGPEPEQPAAGAVGPTPPRPQGRSPLGGTS
ncbi:polyketide synthase dehydratase domain-containing protein [Streptomyces bambusae]|uniref:type I polyketide synthase n=1 Tax=Streptomyces bambusae TaxID=1550616 RepID=UPI001CFEADE0|nr:type I polyketide synthase [Streptomyces bambusae]MCB5164686.1 polyketide synthase dehydratase domain-containing protein [Streptomyces bambusae]